MRTLTEHITYKLAISGFSLETGADGSITCWTRGGERYGQGPDEMSITIQPLPDLEEFLSWYNGLSGNTVKKDNAVARKYLSGKGKWNSLKQRAFFAHHLVEWIGGSK